MSAETISLINALCTLFLVLITLHYARSTHRMLQEMNRQAKIQAISAELTALNSGAASRSGSASSTRAKILIETLHAIIEEK